MANFEIYTDSSCDLSKEMIAKYNLQVMQLEVIIDENPPVLNRDVDSKEFYDKLRSGANAKTAAVTPGFFEEHMRKTLEEGKDILYVGFSSGLSTTYNNGVMIINELKEEFPERKLLDIDTLCASVGQGLLVYYAAVLREKGEDIEAVQKKILAIKDKIHHQVTVDDLFFLKRGGRISAVTAVAGSVLKIKPMIKVDRAGRLFTVGKVRGRKMAVKELFLRMKENAAIGEVPYVFISHSDCLEDVKGLEAMIQAEYPNAEIFISDIGPVIGAHTGPGAIALCYLGVDEKPENGAE
ncbi:MAG: DegV family protein [Lachnospiraceae bacterium]|nr:DegV family protein [Lachnospiraceae bacterium]